MTRKWRFLAWGIYTLGSFIILIIGFDLKISFSISIMTGFLFGLINEVIRLLNKLLEK